MWKSSLWIFVGGKLFCNVLWFLQVLHLQSSGQFLTVSKGGTVGLRDGEDMSLLHTHRLQNSTVAPKDLWVTDMVLLHNVNKVTSTFRRTHDKMLVSQNIDWHCCIVCIRPHYLLSLPNGTNVNKEMNWFVKSILVARYCVARRQTNISLGQLIIDQCFWLMALQGWCCCIIPRKYRFIFLWRPSIIDKQLSISNALIYRFLGNI